MATIFFGAVLLVVLAILAITDWRTYLLPDLYTLPLIACGLLQSWILAPSTMARPALLASLIGAAAGYLVFVAIEIAYMCIKGRDGLGRGDAKLLAAGGAWCGWAALPYIVLISAGAALLALLLPSVRARSDDGAVPFGPFLAFAIFIVWTSAQL